MQETQVLSLGWEDPLEKGMTMQSSFLARRIPWTEEPGGQSMGSQTAGHDWVTDTNTVHQAPQQSHQLSSITQSGLTATPWSAARQASLSVTNSRSLLTHAHRVGDAILPSYPLPSPSPSTFNLSQHQGLFPWVSSLYQVAKPKY